MSPTSASAASISFELGGNLQTAATCLSQTGQRVAIKRGGCNCDARQVHEDAPEIATLRKGTVNRCDFTISVKYVVGHRLEVINKRQVNLGVSEVRCGIGHHGAVIGTDEVVLLSVAVEQRWLWLWTAQRWQSTNEALHVTRKIYR